MATTAVQTAGEICTAALRRAGVVAKDEPADAADMAVAITILDDMLKAWQMTGIKRFTRERLSAITVTSATSSYTLASRVYYIETALWVDASGTETPMLRFTASEYDELPNKSSAGRATSFYHERQREASILRVWPVLATATGETIKLTVQSETEDIDDTSDTVEAPREWYEAIKYNVAEICLDEFAIKDPIITQRIMLKAKTGRDQCFANEREESYTFGVDMAGR